MNMFRYEFACNVFDAKTSPTNVETSMITACSNAKTELEYYNKEQQLAHFPANNVACYVNLLGGINWIIPHYYNVWFIKREKGFLDIIVTSRLMINFVIFDDEQIIKNHRWKRFIDLFHRLKLRIISTLPAFSSCSFSLIIFLKLCPLLSYTKRIFEQYHLLLTIRKTVIFPR